MENRREQLITDFTIYSLDHINEDIDTLVQKFYPTMTDSERNFFTACYQICVGSAEAARTAPQDIQNMIRKGK